MEVQYTEPTQQLRLHLATLGYHARMLLKLEHRTAAKVEEIHWRAAEGSFEGMLGTIRMEDDGRQGTELSLSADYEASKLPLPKTLMGLGLEIVAQRVAIKMRDYIESQLALKSRPQIKSEPKE